MPKRREISVSAEKAASAIQLGRRLGGVGSRTLLKAVKVAGLEAKGLWEPLSYSELRRLVWVLLPMMARSRALKKRGGPKPPPSLS